MYYWLRKKEVKATLLSEEIRWFGIVEFFVELLG